MGRFIKNKEMLIILVFLLIFLVYFAQGIKSWPIEELYPLTGFGYDIDDDLQYGLILTVHRYKGEDEIIAANITGWEKSMGETRDERQLKMDKAFKLGSERVGVISNKQAISGIKEILNILYGNPDMNDRLLLVVCKDKAIDVLNYKVEGYPSAAEYIEGMIKNSRTFNFLSDEYTLLNAYVKVESEGENFVAPYIGIDSQGLSYMGMALFKKHEMVHTLDLDESKIMNMLREDKRSGILTIQKNHKEFINYQAQVKRKVTCNKKDDKYEFIIDLNINGDILVNTKYKKIKMDERKDIEVKIKENVEKMCYAFIDKMKNELKLDCLQLGKYGAAKYGRDTGVDWNEVVCNSNIKLNVKIKVDRVGRGEY